MSNSNENPSSIAESASQQKEHLPPLKNESYSSSSFSEVDNKEQEGEGGGYYAENRTPYYAAPFSEPSSVKTDDEEALSPASSIGSSASAMSISSVDSPVPSPAQSDIDSDRMSVASVSSCGSYKRRRSREEEETCSTKRLKTYPVATHRPLHDPALQAQFEVATEAGDVSLVERLLSTHAYTLRVDPNRYDAEGQTPLQAACSKGELALAKVLVQYGSDVSMRTRDGWSVLHLASFCANPQMLGFVLKASNIQSKKKVVTNKN